MYGFIYDILYVAGWMIGQHPDRKPNFRQWLGYFLYLGGGVFLALLGYAGYLLLTN